jgi:myosin-5
LKLSNPESFNYLNQSGCIKIDGIDDASDFQQIKTSMQVLKFGDHETKIFRILAAILHLGNLTYGVKEDTGKFEMETSQIKNPDCKYPEPEKEKISSTCTRLTRFRPRLTSKLLRTLPSFLSWMGPSSQKRW